MRPVRLTMQAFGPYPGSEIIDFRDAIEAGLFGIYGPTGSGKSTIFSAMTFALFGEPTKSEQDTPSLRSDHAEAGVQTEVEFVFDLGKRRFVVWRRPDQMRPKHRGEGNTRSPHEAFLFDATGLALKDIKDGQRGKVIAEKKVRDVDSAVSQMLGYGPEQFRQIVLLPQGKFETFLSSKTRERVEILRDLFDVSLYRTLATKLKEDAEVAERCVRKEREVCAGRLIAENFASTDALADGIAEAETLHREMLENEKEARSARDAAQTALAAAERVEEQFTAAEKAQKSLAKLQDGKNEIDALADRLERAEKACSLLDVEANVMLVADEVGEAEESLQEAREVAEAAEEKAGSAAQALQKEIERAGEMEALRRKVDEFERYKKTLENADGITEAVENAQEEGREAAGKLDEVQRRLTGLQSSRREKSETLQKARQTESFRQKISSRLATLQSSLDVAETFEQAQQGVRSAKTEVETLATAHEMSGRRADKTRAAFEAAERNLVRVQALHLASNLSPGDPCPVCGATDHPVPATGTVENAGLDQAFRETRDALQQVVKETRMAEQKLTGAQSVLKERQDGLAKVDPPEESAALIWENVDAEQQALGDLGPETNLVEAEADIERLSDEVETLGNERDKLRDAHAELQKQTAATNARLDEMISTVPKPLRAPDTLAVAQEKASRELDKRQEAKVASENAATETREAALRTENEFEASKTALTGCLNRHQNAVKTLGLRLAQAGLTEEEFQALKPAIETIEEDGDRIMCFRRRLGIAEDAAKNAADAIRDQTRPDLSVVEGKRGEAEKKLIGVINERSGAGHRFDHLRQLRDDLVETLRKLDEAEAASGPLRNLAAIVNGDNQQKLDLETFAIGAMFDQVLAAANLRLGPMTANRYQLERDLSGGGRGRRGLGIQAFDIHTGKARSTTTLSGGETFIAALALALGLADVVESASGKIRLDTIFIDEGFGSLDTEGGLGTLDQVLQVLSSLVSQNRAVGLISHVPLVQEAIPNGFYVRKHLAGSSVEARGVN